MRLAIPFAAAAAFALINASGAFAQTSTTIYELNKGTKTTFVDTGKKGVSAGDTLVLSIPLTDGTKKIGTATAVCTVTKAAKKSVPPLVCTGVYALPGGDLMVAGRVTSGPDDLAVTGGTGQYAGARGSIVSTDSKTGTTDVISLV